MIAHDFLSAASICEPSIFHRTTDTQTDSILTVFYINKLNAISLFLFILNQQKREKKNS